MGHKKVPFNKLAPARVKALKKLGFIDYDLRKLNSGQKSRIVVLADQYKHLLSNTDRFYTPKVNKNQKAALKTAGFEVNKGGRAIVPLYEYTGAKLKGDSLYMTGGEGGRSEQIILAQSREFFDRLKQLSTSGKDLPRNQMITVRIGDNNSFSQRFASYWQLYQYLAKDFAHNDTDSTRRQIFARMSIVTVTEPQAAKKTTRRKKGYAQKKGRA